VFLALWMAIPLVVFWLSQSRPPLYILPLFPAFALATAKSLSDWRPRRAVSPLLAV
jgi:hypothetical protein